MVFASERWGLSYLRYVLMVSQPNSVMGECFPSDSDSNHQIWAHCLDLWNDGTALLLTRNQ